MALEKLSVEVEDNSAAVMANMQRLNAAVDKLTTAIDRLSSTETKHVEVQKQMQVYSWIWLTYHERL